MEKKHKLSLNASAVSVVLEPKHPNVMRITGTCMFVNETSTFTPNGVDKPAYLSSDEAERAASTMNLMGINCDYDPWLFPDEVMTAHNRRNKIGVVEKCWVDGNELKFTGIVYKNDFPDIAEYIKKTVDSLGFSVECIFNARELDDRVEMLDVEFTGVAILFKNAAAYQNTYIAEIAAKGRKDTLMEKEQILEIVNEALKAQMEAQAKQAAEAQATKELTDAKAEVERLTAECAAKDASLAEKDAKIAELEKAVEEKQASIEASAKEQSVTSDVNNLETKQKLEAGAKTEFKSWVDVVKAAEAK